MREDELVEWLQLGTGVHTTREPARWLPKLLLLLAAADHRAARPQFGALVVDGRGWVGDRWDDVARLRDTPLAADARARELDAARARLECYRWAGSAPEGGGEPAPVAISAGGRPTSTRSAGASKASGAARSGSSSRPARPAREPAKPRVAASDRPVTICPTCFMALPATGVCDTCG